MMAALKIGYVRKGGHWRSVNVFRQVVTMLRRKQERQQVTRQSALSDRSLGDGVRGRRADAVRREVARRLRAVLAGDAARRKR